MDLSKVTINKIYKFVDYINKEDTEIVDLGKDEIDLLFKLKELNNARVDEALSIIRQKREIIYNVDRLYSLGKREYERLNPEDLKEAQEKIKEIYDYFYFSLFVLYTSN